jgi:hypothetical protein
VNIREEIRFRQMTARVRVRGAGEAGCRALPTAGKREGICF